MVWFRFKISLWTFLDQLSRYVRWLSLAEPLIVRIREATWVKDTNGSPQMSTPIFLFSLTHTLFLSHFRPPHCPLLHCKKGVAASQSHQNGSYLGLGHHHLSAGGMCTCGWVWSWGMQTNYRHFEMNWPQQFQEQYMTVRWHSLNI